MSFGCLLYCLSSLFTMIFAVLSALLLVPSYAVTVGGRSCEGRSLITHKYVSCKKYPPRNDPEGGVCANNGTPLEMYCSYPISWFPIGSCSRCPDPRTVPSSCQVEMKDGIGKGNHGDDSGWYKLDAHSIPSQGVFTDKTMDYIEGSRTYDNFRYSKTTKLPLTTEWTDAKNVRWKVKLISKRAQCTVVVPCGTSNYFYGDEKDRVGMDAQANFCQYSFTYLDGSSHGIRVQTNGYRLKGMGTYLSDTENWKNVMERAKQGADIAAVVVDAAAKAAPLAGRSVDAFVPNSPEAPFNVVPWVAGGAGVIFLGTLAVLFKKSADTKAREPLVGDMA